MDVILDLMKSDVCTTLVCVDRASACQFSVSRKDQSVLAIAIKQYAVYPNQVQCYGNSG